MDSKDLKAIEKVLGEPAFAEFSSNVWKIRSNLMIASVISITVVVADLHIDAGSTILGLKFNGLNDIVIGTGLFVITLYLLFHFIWSAADSLVEWRLRVTGTKVTFVTAAKLASEFGDYPRDPRQSTLYHWWKIEAGKIGNLTDQLSEIQNRLQGWSSRLTDQFQAKSDALNIDNEISSIKSATEAVTRLQKSVEQSLRTIESKRVPVSLERFDSWFHYFLKSQNLRWLLIELAFPVAIGIYALVRLSGAAQISHLF